MGKDHPVAWFSSIKEGRMFNTAMGHTADSFKEKNQLKMLENAIKWAGKLP